MQGARAVQRAIVQGFPGADVSVSIVWINMLPLDSKETARVSARIIEDPRVRHFYDPERRAGKAIAGSLGGQGKTAWDMYLFYTKDSEWGNCPPTPVDWVHQLQGDSWADLARYHSGEDLIEELYRAMDGLSEWHSAQVQLGGLS